MRESLLGGTQPRVEVEKAASFRPGVAVSARGNEYEHILIFVSQTYLVEASLLSSSCSLRACSSSCRACFAVCLDAGNQCNL